MAACSRATMAAATSAGGALRYWLQAFCVSSWASRDCQSGAAVVQLFSMTLSTTAGSTAAFFCCAERRAGAQQHQAGQDDRVPLHGFHPV